MGQLAIQQGGGPPRVVDALAQRANVLAKLLLGRPLLHELIQHGEHAAQHLADVLGQAVRPQNAVGELGTQAQRRAGDPRSRQAEWRVLRGEPLVPPGLHAVWLWMLQGKFSVVDQTPALASVAAAEQRTQGAALPRLRLGLEQARFVGEAVERKRAKVLA